MNKKRISIWGRQFNLEVCHDCYPGEEILDTQKDALKNFSDALPALERAKKEVEQYILKGNPQEFAHKALDNIFKYVMPKSIYVPHDKKHRVIAILCNYKFDMEHGLAVVFENEHFKMIGPEDIVL